MPRRSLLFGAVLTAGACLLLATLQASAHSRPVRFDPAPGAVLEAAPASVTGWFTAELRRDPNWTFIHVSDAQGNRVDVGDAEISADRLQMKVGLRPGLPPGQYLVTWRTYDDGDGAIFGDCHVFFVGREAADAAVAAKSRLDGGRACQRIDVSAREGTPVAGGTPQAAATTAEGHEDEPAAEAGGENGDENGDGDGVPVWGLALGVLAGVVAGGAGGAFVARR